MINFTPFIAAIFLLFLTGCGKENASTNDTNKTSSSNKKVHFIIGYLPSWNINWFDKDNAVSSQIASVNPIYTHIVIAFAKPDLTFDGASFSNTGIDFSSSFSAVRKAIEILHKKNKKVFLAVGGATYRNWQELIEEEGEKIDTTVHKKALYDLIRALNIDGIDIDYEIEGSDNISVTKYYKAVLSLYEVTKQTGTALSLAGWSSGADCTKLTQDAPACNGKISYWTYNAGRERRMFEKLKANGYDPEKMFAHVSIMAYDGGVDRFDPVTFFKNYRSIYKGNLALGFEIPQEAWGDAELVASNSEAKSCQNSSMISGDSYTIYTVEQPYSVERFVTFINRQTHSGIMLWSLYKNKGQSQCKYALDYSEFNEAVSRYLKN